MKRTLALTLALSVAAALFYVSSGSAQTTITIVRATTQQVTNTTTPRRDRFRPYTFTTRGRIIPPGRYCAPGVNPTPGAGNCVPIFCPPGVLDVRYCFLPGRALLCSGNVTVRVQKGNTTISARNVDVRPDCTYQSRVSFRTLLRTRRGTLRFRARFNGNVLLEPRNSITRLVRAG